MIDTDEYEEPECEDECTCEARCNWAMQEVKRLRNALANVMRYPESPWCDTSERNRPIPDDCECDYCEAREVLGWKVCPECEYVSDISDPFDKGHHEECSHLWEDDDE